MSSASAIPPRHVPCSTEWPALSPSKISSHDHHATESDWEIIADTSPAETSFEREAVQIDEPIQKEMQEANSTSEGNSTKGKPLCVKHYPSTPDFRHYDTILEESYDDLGGVLVENDGEVGSLASSSIVMVSGPPSVVSSHSVWSTKISFRDAIMKEKVQETKDQDANEADQQQEAKSPKTTKKRPKFVVTPIKRCSKSTGDLQSLARIAEHDDHYGDDLILGETDAQMYYNQKAQGKLGRKNGRKTRPDEAKRLQITMAKKEDQRQRQQAASKRR
jgi:hypothetical protein